MRSLRIAAALTAFTAALSLVSCFLPFSGSSDSSEPSTAAETTVDPLKSLPMYSSSGSITLDEVREDVKEMLSDLKVSGNSEKISADIDTLLYDYDVCTDICAHNEMLYYLKFDDTDLEEEYDESYRTAYIAYQLITYAFAHCGKNDEYKHLAADHIPDEKIIENYAAPALSLKRLERYSEVDFELLDECTDEYYEVYMDEDMDEDEKSLKCAELYLDLLSQYDPETFYDSYNRDYTPEKAIEICDIAYSKLDPVMDEVRRAFLADDHAREVINEPEEFDSPFDTISEYAGKLSPEIKKAADYISRNELYCITDDDCSYPGSFTIRYPLTDESAIFLNSSGGMAMTNAIHEFGHYYASGFDKTSSYDIITNLDVAEIQSQGFEVIFMRFYDDIFGEMSNAMKLYRTFNMLDSVLSGFLVGKFEYTVLSQRDDMTPQDVVDCWYDIIGDYTDLPFYEITHIFEMPGYYVSYAVSALAAFDIWKDCLSDPDEGLEKYEKLARIPSNSNSTKFLETLEKCGFSSVMTSEYIDSLAQELSEYAREQIN